MMVYKVIVNTKKKDESKRKKDPTDEQRARARCKGGNQ
jgi:hypothetical protein